MKYFEIKPDTKEYSLADKIYNSSNAWSKKEVIEELTKVIGISPIKNMQCNARVLKLWNLPDNVREQFKKNRDKENYYEAFAKSELNQKYLGIVKKYALINYGVIDFVFDIGLFGFLKTLCPIKTDESLRYFVELKENLSNTDIDKVKAKEYLAEIKESEYLQLYTDMVKGQEAKAPEG